MNRVVLRISSECGGGQLHQLLHQLPVELRILSETFRNFDFLEWASDDAPINGLAKTVWQERGWPGGAVGESERVERLVLLDRTS
jgi:hypothetical protein